MLVLDKKDVYIMKHEKAISLWIDAVAGREYKIGIYCSFDDNDKNFPTFYDWGDGTKDKYNRNSGVHTYTKTGQYVINITGNVDCIGIIGEYDKSVNDIKKVKLNTVGGNPSMLGAYYSQYFENTQVEEIDFGDMMLGTQSCHFNYNKELKKISTIKGVIPYYTQFKPNAFLYSCSSLTDLPSVLFQNGDNIVSLVNCFASCISLSNIPETLFSTLTNITNISNMFTSCTSLKTVPSKLLSKNTKLTHVSYLFGNCVNLTSVPDNIFDNCPNIQKFSSCFSGCTSLISAPKLWELYPNSDGYRCYYGCTSLPWYDEIPSNWK